MLSKSFIESYSAQVSTFDLVPFEADEESEGIDALKLDESEEKSDDDDEVRCFSSYLSARISRYSSCWHYSENNSVLSGLQ